MTSDMPRDGHIYCIEMKRIYSPKKKNLSNWISVKEKIVYDVQPKVLAEWDNIPNFSLKRQYSQMLYNLLYFILDFIST